MTHTIPSLHFSFFTYSLSFLGLLPSRLDRVQDLCRGIQSHENKEISQESGDACKSGFPKGFNELVEHIMRRLCRDPLRNCPDQSLSYEEVKGSDKKEINRGR